MWNRDQPFDLDVSLHAEGCFVFSKKRHFPKKSQTPTRSENPGPRPEQSSTVRYVTLNRVITVRFHIPPSIATTLERGETTGTSAMV